MVKRAKSLKPVSTATIVGLLLVCAIIGVYLIPSQRALLERQLRDGNYKQAIDTVRSLSRREKSRRPEYYAALELQLGRRLLDPTNSDEVKAQFTAACVTGVQFRFEGDFLKELLALMPLAPDPLEAYDTVKPHFASMTVETRRQVYSALAAAALAQNKLMEAVNIFRDFWQTAMSSESATKEMVKLWRLAGKPAEGKAVLDAYMQRVEAGQAKLTPDLARLHIQLLREMDQAPQAYEAARKFIEGDPSMRDPLFDDLVTTARESNKLLEIVHEARQHAEARPTDVGAWEMLGNLETAGSKLEEAIKSYKKLHELRPDHIPYVLRIAQLSEWSSQPNQAFDFYRTALSMGDGTVLERLFDLSSGLFREPELADALDKVEDLVFAQNFGLRYARLHGNAGNFDRALKLYERLLSTTPNDIEPLREQARLLFHLYEFEQALPLVLNLEKLTPDDPRVVKAVAEALYRLDRFEEALQRYERLTQTSDDPEALEHFVNLAESLGQIDSAIEGLRRKIKNSASVTPRDYARLAYFLNVNGDTDEMVKVVKAGLAKFPAENALRLQAAYALSDEKRYSEAAQIIAPHPDLQRKPEIAQMYVTLLVHSDSYAEAESFLTSKLDPVVRDHPAVLKAQVMVHEATKNLKAAAVVYKRLHEKEPANSEHLANEARVLTDLGKPKEAANAISRIANPTPEQLFQAAQLYTAIADYRRAEAFHRRYLATQPPELPKMWGFLGDILLSRGDRQNAKRAYQRGLGYLLEEVTSGPPEEEAAADQQPTQPQSDPKPDGLSLPEASTESERGNMSDVDVASDDQMRIALDPSLPLDHRRYLVYLYARLNKPKVAQTLATRILAENPSDKQTLLVLASMFVEQEDAAMALRTARELVKYFPSDHQALYFLGASYYLAGHYEKANDVFRDLKLSQFSGKLFPYETDLASAALKSGDWFRAMQSYQQILRKHSLSDDLRQDARSILEQIYRDHKPMIDIEETIALLDTGLIYRTTVEHRRHITDSTVAFTTLTREDVKTDPRPGIAGRWADYVDGLVGLRKTFSKKWETAVWIGGAENGLRGGASTARTFGEQRKATLEVQANQRANDGLILQVLDGRENRIRLFAEYYDERSWLGGLQVHGRHVVVANRTLGYGYGLNWFAEHVFTHDKPDFRIGYRGMWHSSTRTLNDLNVVNPIAEPGATDDVRFGILDNLILPQLHRHGVYWAYRDQVSGMLFYHFGGGTDYDVDLATIEYNGSAGFEFYPRKSLELRGEAGYSSSAGTADLGSLWQISVALRHWF